MLNIEDGLVHCTDRNVPGSRIRLEFTIMAKDRQFLATINAVRPGQEDHLPGQELAEPLRKIFCGLRRDRIIEWTVAQAEKINEGFGLGDANIGYLRGELGHLMDIPEGCTNLPFIGQHATESVRDIDPAPVPEPPAATPETRQLAPDDLLTSEDVWEAKIESANPRQDIVSLLTVRKGTNGFAVHLRVEMGEDWAEQLTAVGSIPEVSDWLRRFDVAAEVAQRLGTEEPGAYAFVRRWVERFTIPLEQFHLRVTQPHLFWSDDEKYRRRLVCPGT